MKALKLDGTISVSRPLNAPSHKDGFHITLTDDVSNVQFASIHVGLAEFAKALSSEGHIPVSITLRMLDKLGLVRELKKAFVPDLGSEGKSLAPFRVDGWEPGRAGEFGNHHYRHEHGGVKGYVCSFVRWVEKEVSDEGD